MAIASAVQRDSSVYVYNERGVLVSLVFVGNEPGDGLQGYTSTTVSVKRGSQVYVYDEKGILKSDVLAR